MTAATDGDMRAQLRHFGLACIYWLSEVILGKFFSALAAFGVALVIGCCADAAAVKIAVENVRVGRGNLHLALFNSYESWDREAPILNPEFPPTPGRTEIRLELPPETIAF